MTPSTPRRPYPWAVASLSAVVAGSCVATTESLFAVPAFLAFLGAVVFSTTYGGLATGLFTAIAGWAFSNVLCLAPVGELSFHGQALSLLAVYVAAAALAAVARARLLAAH